MVRFVQAGRGASPQRRCAMPADYQRRFYAAICGPSAEALELLAHMPGAFLSGGGGRFACLGWTRTTCRLEQTTVSFN
jgi:hypothetical protein